MKNGDKVILMPYDHILCCLKNVKNYVLTEVPESIAKQLADKEAKIINTKIREDLVEISIEDILVPHERFPAAKKPKLFRIPVDCIRETELKEQEPKKNGRPKFTTNIYEYEVVDQINCAKLAQTTYINLNKTYEQGIIDALHWMGGHEAHPPLDMEKVERIRKSKTMYFQQLALSKNDYDVAMVIRIYADQTTEIVENIQEMERSTFIEKVEEVKKKYKIDK